MQETQFDSWVGKFPWRRDRLPTPVLMGFPGGSAGKEFTCNVGGLGSIPGLGRSPGGGHGNPLQYSCLENPHVQRSLADYNPWGPEESDTTEWLSTHSTCLTHLYRVTHMDLCLGPAQFPGTRFTWPSMGQAWVSLGDIDELAVVGRGAAPGPLCSPRAS